MRNMVIIGSGPAGLTADRKSTRLNSSHDQISYAVFCLKKKKKEISTDTDNRRVPEVLVERLQEKNDTEINVLCEGIIRILMIRNCLGRHPTVCEPPSGW